MARSILFAADGTPAASRALGLLEGYRGDAAAIDVLAFLAHLPLFEGLGPAELARLAAGTVAVTLPAPKRAVAPRLNLSAEHIARLRDWSQQPII